MITTLAEQIDALLPQTQCRKCGFEGCKPYAEAITQGLADINQCPPGGAIGINKLSALLGVTAKPLDPKFGLERPRLAAYINEADCIGCTKCIPPCPVDAILGASKQLHTVITDECTGCELCIAPCPVNCISLQPAIPDSWNNEDAERSRLRHQAKIQRINRLETEKTERLQRQKELLIKVKQTKTRF